MGCRHVRRHGLPARRRTRRRAVVSRRRHRLSACVVYVELHTSSAFSFLRAASLPETLIERAAMLGYPAVALLDRDGVSGAPRFHKAALAAGIKPLIGAELSIALGTGQQVTRSQDHELTKFALPVLVSSQDGWRNLCR